MPNLDPSDRDNYDWRRATFLEVCETVADCDTLLDGNTHGSCLSFIHDTVALFRGQAVEYRESTKGGSFWIGTLK